MSSSLDNVNVSKANEENYIDFSAEKENRKPNSRKREAAVPSEWKRYETNEFYVHGTVHP